MSKCPRCDSNLNYNDNYCWNCGQQIEKLDSEDQTISNIFKAFMNLIIPRKPIEKVTNVIYEKLPAESKFSSIKFMFFIAILFIAYFLIEIYFSSTLYLSDVMYFVATFGVALLFLYWVYKSDRYEREPFKFVIYVFVWGVFSGILVAPLNSFFSPYFQFLFGNASLVAAFIEEPIKALGLYFLVRHKDYGKEFNTPLDGIIYGFSAGMGFFAMENFTYYQFYGPENLIVRFFLTWGHGVWVATTGLWLAIGKIHRGKIKAIDIMPGLLVAIFLHFLWNGIQIIIIQSIFHLYYLQKIIREAKREEVLWGYADGKAPIE